MTTIILSIDNERNATKIFEALQLFKGVKKINCISDDLSQTDIMQEITLGFEQVKQIKDGKLPRKTLKQMLDGK